MSRYVINYRVSTKKQGESRPGLDVQRAQVRHFYEQKPVLAGLVGVRPGKTGSKRPVLMNAPGLCKWQWATLVVDEVDRLN